MLILKFKNQDENIKNVLNILSIIKISNGC